MAFLPNNNNNQGMLVPTSIIYDAQRLQETDVNSKDFKQLLVRLYQSINIISLAINKREVGMYPLEEFVIGNLYYNPSSAAISDFRPIFRTTYNTGALGAGVTNIPHGFPTPIPDSWQFVHIYGAANDRVTHVYYPMPTTLLTVSLDATNIIITNGTGVTFTSSSIVIEYSKT